MRVTRVTIDPDVMGGMPCIRGLHPSGDCIAMVADPRFSPNFLELAKQTSLRPCDTVVVPNEILQSIQPGNKVDITPLPNALTATTNPATLMHTVHPVIEHRA